MLSCLRCNFRQRGLTLLEMIIALAIIAVVFAAMLPQFRNIQNSWDSKRVNAEIIQNGRVLTEYLNRYLAKAVRITDVSGPTEMDGYVEFLGADEVTYRCDIGANEYIEFGPVGSLAELAGPVNRLQFSCYTLNDLDNTTTVLSAIRFVKVETTFTNPEGSGEGKMGSNKDFMTQVYVQTNWNDIESLQNNGSAIEFDAVIGQDTALAQVDATHYLLAYTGSGDVGYALILTVDAVAGTITCGTESEFDTTMGRTPALSQVDGTHYLCTYEGNSQEGYAVILTVNTSDWTISAGTALDFETNGADNSDLCQIDSTHYLCAYQGDMDDGYAVVLTVNTSTWEITAGSSLEFDTQDGKTPSLTQIDGTHYLCAYEGASGVGKAVVLTVDTGDWSISKKSPHTFDSGTILTPVLCSIDGIHHLCVWQGYADKDGQAVVLTVNDTMWTTSSETLFEFDMQATEPALCKIDAETYVCACESQGNAGSVVVLDVNLSDYSIARGVPYEFDEYTPDTSPDLCQIDSNNYLCSYTGDEADGWAVILCLGIRP
jgi:prepilin-type N-terminal cleavage/methylation domain-containing protein